MDGDISDAIARNQRDDFLEFQNLAEYLKSLSANIIEELHGYPGPCLAIFRVLPRLAKHYVQRILYVEIPVPQAVIESWSLKEHRAEHLQAVDALTSLRVWNETSISGGLLGYTLSRKFRHNLKVALLGGGQAWTNSKHLDYDAKARTIKDIDAYAIGRWEALLQFLADKQVQDDSVSGDTIHTLIHAGLMENDSSSRPVITNKGFQFLLLDTASQVWYFLIKYLETVESRQLSVVECLNFLFTLSFGVLGKDYSTDGIGDHMQPFMQHLREFGLVYRRSRKVNRFYPTRLAVDFYNPNRRLALNTEQHQTGFIFVETNYRLYAYTHSDLQLALVGMFTELLYRFPNLAVGVITRESVRQALRNGIKGDQIISYLEMHSHPEISKTPDGAKNPLPPTIVDQIRLWELERSRFTFTDGVLYNQFLSQQDYELVRSFAQDNKVLLHSSDQKKTVIVKKDGHELVKKFWKRHSKGNS